MEKYIGNKKSILEHIEGFMLTKGMKSGVFFDVFTGTTNVAQYFKQRGFSIISNDANSFTYALQKTYIENNSFPQYDSVVKSIRRKGFTPDPSEIEHYRQLSLKKILQDKIYLMNYEQKTDYLANISPLIEVVCYLNSLSPEKASSYAELFFFEHYCQSGSKSEFKSARGTVGKRNYLTKYNAIKLGMFLTTIVDWLQSGLITDLEYYILLTSIIEEVTLVANVNGTFHDFNRKKLFPNALVDILLKPPILNIVSDSPQDYRVYCEDSNELIKKLQLFCDVIYIDPPYNFRQYSSYYHLLNLIATFHEIDSLKKYGANLKFVRGQNLLYDWSSRYCYKDQFIPTLRDLVSNVKGNHVMISYYDENNHWNHGKKDKSLIGRELIQSLLADKALFLKSDPHPFLINRANYQSQNGHRKKRIEELLFYGIKG